jgi:hypothetical protein
MPKRPDGSWFPSFCAKQAEVTHSFRGLDLVSGPKFCGKSTACLHAIANHMWNFNTTDVFIGKTASELANQGLWQHFADKTIPEWVDGRFGMELVQESKLNRYQKLELKVSNRHGGVSTAILDSLEYEHLVEKKFKGKEYGLIYIPELSKHRDRLVFDILIDCLRGQDMPADQYRLLCDTNPDDEGEDSWIWKIWYRDRVCDWSKIEEPDERERIRTMQPKLGLIEFHLSDNIFLTEEQQAFQRAKYRHSKDLFDRYVDGKWVKASGTGYFNEVWIPNIHVIGEEPKTPDEDCEMLLPEANCAKLATSWDLGPANPSVHIIEPVTVSAPRIGKPPDEVPAFKTLDEFCVIGERTPTADAVEWALERMAFWETFLGRKVRWEHVSDRNAFDTYIAAGDTYEWKEVFRLSDGEILLTAETTKAPGSVMRRMEFMARLLFEHRYWISKRCPKLIEAFSSIKTNRAGRIAKNDPRKHPLDSGSYYPCQICWNEIDDKLLFPKSGSQDGSSVVIKRF